VDEAARKRNYPDATAKGEKRKERENLPLLEETCPFLSLSFFRFSSPSSF